MTVTPRKPLQAKTALQRLLYIPIVCILKPYLKKLMREASENGSPLMRTMFYEFPEDSACWNCTDQYMFGEKYLVAPVLYEGMRRRSVYLPAGQWKDLESGEVLAGGRTVEADAPLDVIPVFERLG